jgi:hypothetical protein
MCLAVAIIRQSGALDRQTVSHHADVVHGGPDRAVGLGVLAHRPEPDDLERTAALADVLLPVKHRAR